jgi:hypothetical protein
MRKRAAGTVGRLRSASVQAVELGARPREWLRLLERETNAHPFRTAGLVAGAGFVLGGGLFTPLMGRVLSVGVRLAMRMAIVPALARGLGEMSEELLEGSVGFGSTSTNGEGKKS